MKTEEIIEMLKKAAKYYDEGDKILGNLYMKLEKERKNES